MRHEVAQERRAYVHVARGNVHVNGSPLAAGDGVLLEGEPSITLDRAAAAEVLLLDLA